MSTETDLSKSMRALAEKRPKAIADELRQLADAFDKATSEAYGPDGTPEDTKRMLGAWARARRVYCRETGEPLV